VTIESNLKFRAINFFDNNGSCYSSIIPDPDHETESLLLFYHLKPPRSQEPNVDLFRVVQEFVNLLNIFLRADSGDTSTYIVVKTLFDESGLEKIVSRDIAIEPSKIGDLSTTLNTVCVLPDYHYIIIQRTAHYITRAVYAKVIDHDLSLILLIGSFEWLTQRYYEDPDDGPSAVHKFTKFFEE